MPTQPDLVVIYEHPEWQKPLFEALTARGVAFETLDLKSAAFCETDRPRARLYFNQASPSAYLRGNARAVSHGLAVMEDLDLQGVRVLNGARAFRFELSKIAQARAMAEVQTLLDRQPDLWFPDNLLLLQEYLPHDAPGRGIVRLEFLGGELLYAMRVRSDGAFNLCPSEVCHPGDGEDGACEIPAEKPKMPVTFEPYPEVPAEAVATAKRIFDAGGLDVGGIEYLETPDGRRVFYDVNANSNLRRPVAQHFGFDPFERVVDFLVRHIEQTRG